MRHQVELPRDPSSPKRARRFVRWLLQEWGYDTDLTEDAALLVTELVTNAIIHARTEVVLTVSRRDGGLDFAVTDHGEGTIRLESPDPTAVTGRGIFLLERLAPGWEVETDGATKTVHFSLAGLEERTGTSS